MDVEDLSGRNAQLKALSEKPYKTSELKTSIQSLLKDAWHDSGFLEQVFKIVAEHLADLKDSVDSVAETAVALAVNYDVDSAKLETFVHTVRNPEIVIQKLISKKLRSETAFRFVPCIIEIDPRIKNNLPLMRTVLKTLVKCKCSDVLLYKVINLFDNFQDLSQKLSKPCQEFLNSKLDYKIIMKSIENSDKWEQKYEAIKSLLLVLQISKQVDDTVYDLARLLLKHPNVRVQQATLSLLEFLSETENVQDCIKLFIYECIDKLGNNKISIRKASFRIFKNLLSRSSLEPYLLEALNSPNWHIREEVMNLLIVHMLESYSVDCLSLVMPFAKMLDDSKTKIRYVASEALAVCAHKCGIPSVLQILSPIADVGALNSLQERFLANALPVIKTDSIEFPKRVASSAPHYVLSNDPIDNASRSGRRKFEQIDRNQPDFSSTMYLTKEEIYPLTSPEQNLKQCLNCNSGSWEDQFESLNILRRLLKYHPHLFSQSVIHELVQQITVYADSMRSSLCKNALIVIKEMSLFLGKLVDSELPALLPILFKKVVQTNVFISEEAWNAMETICKNSNSQKTLSILLQASRTKSPAIKVKLCNCFSIILARGRIKDLEKVTRLLSNYAADASPSVRVAAKKALQMIDKKNDTWKMRYEELKGMDPMNTNSETLSKYLADSHPKVKVRALKLTQKSIPFLQQENVQTVIDALAPALSSTHSIISDLAKAIHGEITAKLNGK